MTDKNADPWLEAIKQAEETGDLSALVSVLRSGAPLDESVRKRLAKLAEDYELEPLDGKRK
jgi:hypothetical protein